MIQYDLFPESAEWVRRYKVLAYRLQYKRSPESNTTRGTPVGMEDYQAVQHLLQPHQRFISEECTMASHIMFAGHPIYPAIWEYT